MDNYGGARVGTAGWTIPAAVRSAFPTSGSTLERYAARFSCVEINSPFYRPHRPTTYERWAAAVPATFRFAVKVPKAITHERRLVDAVEPLERFLDETAALGHKRDVLLIQLPPSLAYDAQIAGGFLSALRQRYAGQAACEPRHASWLTDAANRTLRSFSIARVAADPALAGGGEPGGDLAFRYFRWHGSPRRYYDAYGDERLCALARLGAPDASTWCIFDNTASGAATSDALHFKKVIAQCAWLPREQFRNSDAR